MDYQADTVLNNTQLLGDDFFLSILTSELNFPLTRSKSIHKFGALQLPFIANVCSDLDEYKFQNRHVSLDYANRALAYAVQLICSKQ